jgi:23S rRNA (cytidine2498-2'-O)-methyltransferase
MKITPLRGRVFHALAEFEGHLRQELGSWQEAWGPLYYVSGEGEFLGEPAGGPAAQAVTPPAAVLCTSFWNRNIWLEPFRVEFDSLSEAASALRAVQRNWAPALSACFRRGALLAEKLPPLSAKPRPFPWALPDAPMGSWTLLDAHTMIASARCTSPFPNGFIAFEEDVQGPPSRAYLKLWEALVRRRRFPAAGERCLDAGASPGGWTWALAGLGARVTAVDRAPLEERIAALPQVSFIRHDAFTLRPEDIGPLDWLFCDVICYPPRLYEWIERWLQSGLCRNFVCTIKMQGRPDFETTRRFAAIPGGNVVHLCHNKHELTWIKTA